MSQDPKYHKEYHTGWRHDLHTIIFEADTPKGKTFDVALIITILISLLGMMLESVDEFHHKYDVPLRILDWTITILFTIEYALRILITGKPRKYIFSFYGIVDLLSILPTYLSFVFGGVYALSAIRAIRLLRVFRVLKLVQFVSEGRSLIHSVQYSMNKIIVFLIFILTITTIIGTIMFLIEGPGNGFTSIPKGIYWAIVTLTTIGYGDVVPHTALGQTLASFIMILGYGLIAIPTGIVTAGFIQGNPKKKELNAETFTTISCPECSLEGHDHNAKFCKYCGAILD